jgi:hypothetical protein
MDIEDCLSDLLDDPEFESIGQQFDRFNLFEAVGGVRRELAHSNFLAFLLSPDRPHGLGAEILKRILRGLIETLPKEKRPIRVLDVVTGELDDAIVFRERENIDILIELRELRLVVAIENKVGARASPGQLERYVGVVRRLFPDRRHLFVFLTPDGADPEHDDYVAITYSDLARSIEGLLATTPPAPEIGIVLRHYLEMLRRHVVQDEKLKELALKVYERHKEALDFIFDCRPEPGSLLGVVSDLMKRDSRLIEDRTIGSIARFVPTAWSSEPALNACAAEVWTKTGRNLLFEVKSFKSEANDFSDRILLALVLGPSDPKLREHFFASARANPSLFVGGTATIGKQYATLYSKELLSKNAAKSMDEDQKIAALNAAWSAFAEHDLPHLTDAVINLAQTAPLEPSP